MITMICLAWGLGIVFICAFVWGTQHTQISEQQEREIVIAELEAAVERRNRFR